MQDGEAISRAYRVARTSDAWSPVGFSQTSDLGTGTGARRAD